MDESMRWTVDRYAEKKKFRKYVKINSPISFEKFYDLVYLRQTVRHFSDKELSDHIIKKILSAGIGAPCSCNRQSWRFKILKNKEDKRFISGINGDPKIARAPIVVIFLIEKENYRKREGKGTPYLDTGVAAQNILLATTSLGVASCFVNMGHIKGARKRRMHRYFDIDSKKMVTCLILLGYPEKKIVKPVRNNISKYLI